MGVGNNDFVRDECVIANGHLTIRCENHADQRTEVPDFELSIASEIEKCSIVNTRIVSNADAEGTLTSVVNKCIRTVQPSILAEAHVFWQRL
jgi:hypothetical protein